MVCMSLSLKVTYRETTMFTGVCPLCDERMILVCKESTTFDDKLQVRKSLGYVYVVRSHECGTDLLPFDMLSLEDSYLRKGLSTRMKNPSDLPRTPL
jgi:predicted RNA-binding Zn-ribbon protein involved in translation (DUF1610 family)